MDGRDEITPDFTGALQGLLALTHTQCPFANTNQATSRLQLRERESELEGISTDDFLHLPAVLQLKKPRSPRGTWLAWDPAARKWHSGYQNSRFSKLTPEVELFS